MASLTNTKIKNTYVSLLKVADNGQLDGTLQDITDGAGNTTGVQLNTGGDLTASGTVAFGSLKDSGENITITKFVDAADGIGSNNNDTTIPTSAAVTAYVASQITLEDLDFAGDSGTGSVDLDSQTLTIQGTANEIETVAGSQTLTIGLPSTINVNVNGNLTGNITPTSVLQDGVTATTQLTSDNSTKVATTAFVKSVVTAENLDIAGTSGTGSVDLDSQTLTIAGTTNEIETSASGQTITVGLPSDVIIGNDLTVTTDASVGGILDVTGAAGVDGNFDVATNKFTVQAATGNTAVAGTLGVTGNTTLSTVDVTGLASLDGGIDVDGAFTVANTSGDISTSGDLGVTGTSTLGVINASGLASLDGGIDVDGAFTVSDTTGNIQTSGTLGVTGTTSLTDDLAVDTDTLFVDASADRVGINKNNPAVALDVNGDITSSGTITGTTLAGTLSTAAQTNITSVGTLSSLAVSGDVSIADKIVHTGDTNTAIRFPSADTIAFETSGAEAVRIDDSGNVGIGIQAPTTKLYVKSSSVNVASFDSTFGQMAISLTNNGSAFAVIGSGVSVTGTAAADDLGFGTAGLNKNIVFATGAGYTERMRILSSGGITFNGDTAAANALDDYEEGTWTMGVSFGGAAVGVTYGSNTGTYTKIGRQVTANGFLTLTSKGSSAGAAAITGLPFTIGSDNSNYAPPSLLFNDITFTNQFQGYGLVNSTNILLEEITILGVVSDITDVDFTNNSLLIISLTYFV
jgi:hypothetical protein